MERQNITLSLPRDLLKTARHLAVERGTSLSALLAEYLQRMVQEDKNYQRAAGRMKKRLKDGFVLGTGGEIVWTRADLYER
jgi:hypothetical protein